MPFLSFRYCLNSKKLYGEVINLLFLSLLKRLYEANALQSIKKKKELPNLTQRKREPPIFMSYLSLQVGLLMYCRKTINVMARAGTAGGTSEILGTLSNKTQSRRRDGQPTEIQQSSILFE